MSGFAKALRVLALVLAGLAFYSGVTAYKQTRFDIPAWYWVGASLLLSVLWQWRMDPASWPAALRRVAPGAWPGTVFGLLLALGGAGLFVRASVALHLDWATSFDHTWLTWVGAATAMAVGLDLAWGRWPRPSGLWSRRDFAIVTVLLVVAAALRAYGLSVFPGPYHVTQIEVAQVGNFGAQYLAGSRIRWEYLSHMWLSALGQSLFTNDLVSVRIPFAVANTLKIVPLYFCLRWLVGRPGAVAAAALLACSGWDIMLSRIPSNQNELTAALSFALLAGPARRGRPSAYVFLGLIAGYVFYEYIAYRPLAGFIVLGAAWLSLRDRSVGLPRRIFRPVLTLALMAAVATPLFTGKLTERVGYQYWDGWNRARGHEYYTEKSDWRGTLNKRVVRARTAFGALLFRGDTAVVRNVNERPVLDPVTGAFWVAGIAYAASHWGFALVPLSLMAFLVTFTGTLIATGNFDMARAGCNVFYTHMLVGFGTAGLAALLSSLLGGWRRRGVVVFAVLGALVAAAALSNWRFINEYWHSPEVRRAQHLELAYQTKWLTDAVRPDERVVGLSVWASMVLIGNDASWMRGEHVHGTVVADLWAFVDELQKKRDENLFLYIAAEDAGALAVDFLQTIWPQLHFEYQEHPERPLAGAYVTRLKKSDPLEVDPPGLAEARCRSARGTFVVHFATAGDRSYPTLFPFVERSTWPAVLRSSHTLWQGSELAAKLSLELRAIFTVEQPGSYLFITSAREGAPTITVGGNSGRGSGGVSAQLEAGTHELVLTSDFTSRSSEPQIRLDWRGPDTGGKPEMMPIYRLTPLDPHCVGAKNEAGPVAEPVTTVVD